MNAWIERLRFVSAHRSPAMWAVAALVFLGGSVRAEEVPTFFRGLNLNGPPVVIDGNQWEGQDSKHYQCKDQAFDSQSVPLVPATDPERAKMIRSSRWGGNDLALTDIPSGTYSVFLYVWEDNNSETYSIAVNGREVATNYKSGELGHWERLGPWVTTASDGTIRLTSRGGAANFSGVELWRGDYIKFATAEPTPEGADFFEKKIRPLLVQHCYECHSVESEEAQGELLVDSRAAIRRGGSQGPAVVPGQLDQSLLLKAVRYTDDELQMPPDEKLPAYAIADLEKWIKLGAPDPRKDDTTELRKKLALDKAREFWSFKPIVDPPAPSVSEPNWAFNDIDRFILHRLEETGLRPVATADKRTLIRRATFDLIGLPPTPEEIQSFLADHSADAYPKVVERLLASPHYGERWGRHWMDLVRYADTAGDNSDFPIPQAYLYRNYIINSFNADKPYDQFVREQIAGDLMPAESDLQRNEQTIATGYIASSRRFGSVIEDYPQHLTIEDTIDNLGRTFLGLTISCARCHDHKFDPISSEDYYGLYGIFDSTRYPFPGIELQQKPRDFVKLVGGGQLAYAVAEAKPADARIQLRGEPKKQGELVPRKFLDVLGGQRLSGEEAEASGRLQLAQWLTSRDNPLFARVMVNRIWQHHFGSGLVETPSDFGSRGQPPSHPELLDYLASGFMANGWSIKQMHRLILLSHTYQLASSDDPGNLAVDPANDLHWKFSRRRFDAETLRDTVLAISGELDRSMMDEPHPFPPADQWKYTQHHPFRDTYPSKQRSVYLMTARLNAAPFFVTFDGADRNASTPKRDSSVTTVQSLYLLNSEFIHEQATKTAERLIRDRGDDDARLQLAYEMMFGRLPRDDERSAAGEFLAQIRAQEQSEDAGRRDQSAWESLARVLFRSNEFLHVD